jgi:hypothetical protein
LVPSAEIISREGLDTCIMGWGARVFEVSSAAGYAARPALAAGTLSQLCRKVQTGIKNGGKTLSRG